MSKKDYYQILGVQKNASADEIKRSFRRLAQEHHPDKGGSHDKFKEINEAYQVLSDEPKRKQYDQFGTTFDGAGGPGAGGFGGAGFNWQDFAGAQGFGGQGFNGAQGFDFQDLGDIVGDLFGMGGRGGQRGPSKGRDLQYNVTIDFKESAFGLEKTLNIKKKVVCATCKGAGGEPGTKTKQCATCKGAGQVRKTQNILFGSFQTVATCPDCHGQGQIPEKVCHVCRGAGVETKAQDLKVKIPGGIADGQAIKLSGAGEAGEHGAGSGDLYVVVSVKPDHVFDRHEDNVLSREEISFPLAALGGKTKVRTVDGDIELKIPAGTQSGQVFKLKGHGMPSLHGHARGDQWVTIHVKTPEKLSGKASKLINELSAEL